MHYAHNLWHGLDVFWATIVLLGLFAAAQRRRHHRVGGRRARRSSSSTWLTLTVLSRRRAASRSLRDPSLLARELARSRPRTGCGRALFFGFAAAMLGISGFESSANFIEEQKPGVFPKTLRNMWIAVAVFNPLISLLSLGPAAARARSSEVPPDLLAQMGDALARAGRCGAWVSIDAVLVLSGAVLTSLRRRHRAWCGA